MVKLYQVLLVLESGTLLPLKYDKCLIFSNSDHKFKPQLKHREMNDLQVNIKVLRQCSVCYLC